MNLLKNEAQELDDEHEMAAARKYFVKMQLEGEKPTKFFCNLNKNFWKKHSLKNYTWLKRNQTEKNKFELLQNREL